MEILSKDPLVFISYAWTDATYQEWVVDLAARLRGDGVETILDVWHLKPGQDKYRFMERSVTDENVKHVLMICNSQYASKANDRRGGVGEETQIITPELYQSTSNEKFIPIISEMDKNGEPFIPAYLKSRIYINLSSSQKYYEEYEKLLRVIHGSPAFSMPKLGKKPSFLNDDSAIGSTTSPLHRHAIQALRDEKKNAVILVKDYFLALNIALKDLRVKHDIDKQIDDEVIDAIHQSKIYRDEFLELLNLLCNLESSYFIENILIEMFEGLLYNSHVQEAGSVYKGEFDAIKFITTEIFIYTIAVLLINEKLDIVIKLLKERYILKTIENKRSVSYTSFIAQLDSLVTRQQRLGIRSINLFADLIRNRADQALISFETIQQTDFLIFIHSKIHENNVFFWHPLTLIFLGDYPQPFDIFLAPESNRSKSKLKAILGTESIDELYKLAAEIFPDPQSQYLNFGSFCNTPILPLMNIKTLK